jgi:hypothetical protein
MNRSVLFLIGITCVASVALTAVAQAETLVESSLFFRIYVAFSVDQKAAQEWLPAPWKVSSLPKGPFKDANLFVIFDDRFLNQDAEGKPTMGGTCRLAILVVLAKHPQTGEFSPFIIRAYIPLDGPGAYKNAVKAMVRRGATLQGANLEPGTGTEVWRVWDSAGGVLEFWIDYQRAVPKRVKKEFRARSNVEPDFFRIYQDEHAVDVVKSISAGIDRLQNYQFRVTMSELREMFDGSEQLIGISLNPIWVRQVFLP